MERIKTALAGIMVGISNIIPGISGGTVLVLLGLYDLTLTSAVNLAKRDKRKAALIFIGILMVGVLVGLVLGSVTIKFFLREFYTETLVFFGGLIIFSTPKLVSDELKNKTKFKLLPLMVSFIVLLSITIYTLDMDSSKEVIETIPNIEIGLLLFLTLSGAIAGLAMIFPGISGSMIQLIIGSYVYFTSFISMIFEMNINLFIYLSFMALGVFIGIFGGILVSKYLLEKQRDITMSVILGLIYASTLGLFIKAFYKITNYTEKLIPSIILLSVSAIIIFLMERISHKIKSA